VQGQGRFRGPSLGVPAHGKLGEIVMGPLDSDPGVRSAGHIFVSSKAEWFQIADALTWRDRRPLA
jgi:hypothetical protein